MIISQGDMNENVNMGQIRRRSLLSILKGAEQKELGAGDKEWEFLLKLSLSE